MPEVGVEWEHSAQDGGSPSDFRLGPTIVYPPKAPKGDTAVGLYPVGPKDRHCIQWMS